MLASIRRILYDVSEMRSLKGLADGWPTAMAWACATVCLILATGCTNFYGRGIQYQIEHRYAVSDPQFVRTMGNLVDPGFASSNKVTALLNGDQIFPAMLDAVKGAKRSISLETYIYWSGEIGETFAQALAERAKAGVKVHVVIDWIG